MPGGSHSWPMRRSAVFLVLILAACIPSRSDQRPAPPEAVPGDEREPASAAARQCRADLEREGIGFRALEDRRFEGGCSAIGSVQLLEIGTPVTNLGAMTCPLARQFARWVRDTVQPAARQRLGSPVRRIESFGTYACRSVNSRPGARISEHGRANAVDVAAFVLADGRRVTVQQGWRGEESEVRLFLRDVHRGGCRHFNIGLGPDSDSYHYNHLHFDMGRGPYCR
jgi:hypothetical protein